MGEAKKRREAGHLPPEGMINLTGPLMRELSAKVAQAVYQACDAGMTPEHATQAVLATAVDIWRANYGDTDLKRCFKTTLDRRMEKPMEYWGVSRGS